MARTFTAAAMILLLAPAAALAQERATDAALRRGSRRRGARADRRGSGSIHRLFGRTFDFAVLGR